MSNKLQHLVVFSGAGVSAESGLRTFRDGDGLWEQHRIEDVATPQAWDRDPELVLKFYDMRREQAANAQPNAAHRAIADLEDHFNVSVVTQNIDDLHERAGSTHVLHLHGEIFKARSSVDPELIYSMQELNIPLGAICEKGSQLRPHIVWFGEAVPMLEKALEVIASADMLVVIGTSLVVYPAAGLVQYAPDHAPIYIIDPSDVPLTGSRVVHRKEKASLGMPKLALELID